MICIWDFSFGCKFHYLLLLNWWIKAVSKKMFFYKGVVIKVLFEVNRMENYTHTV